MPRVDLARFSMAGPRPDRNLFPGSSCVHQVRNCVRTGEYAHLCCGATHATSGYKLMQKNLQEAAKPCVSMRYYGTSVCRPIRNVCWCAPMSTQSPVQHHAQVCTWQCGPSSGPGIEWCAPSLGTKAYTQLQVCMAPHSASPVRIPRERIQNTRITRIRPDKDYKDYEDKAYMTQAREHCKAAHRQTATA